jgi:hypothetical protein
VKVEVFRLPTWPWIPAFALLQVPGIVHVGVAEGAASAFVAALVGALFVGFVVWTGQISIGPEGIAIYRINRMRWNDAVSARPRRVLGLRYVHVQRSRGMSWWVPLYFIGGRDLREALVDYAPESNPISLCLADTPNEPLQPTPLRRRG